MSNNIIYLDLEEINLFGWERRKSDLVIDSMIRGIEAGDEFPAVPVVKADEKTYFLSSNNLTYSSSNYSDNTIGYVDGGHHRAVAHYITRGKLRCRLVDSEIPRPEKRVHVKDILITDDDGQYRIKRKRFAIYR